MSLNEEPNGLDKLFSQGLEGLDRQPAPQLWDAIESGLDAAQGRQRMLYWRVAASLVGLLLMGGLVLGLYKRKQGLEDRTLAQTAARPHDSLGGGRETPSPKQAKTTLPTPDSKRQEKSSQEPSKTAPSGKSRQIRQDRPDFRLFQGMPLGARDTKAGDSSTPTPIVSPSQGPLPAIQVPVAQEPSLEELIAWQRERLAAEGIAWEEGAESDSSEWVIDYKPSLPLVVGNDTLKGANTPKQSEGKSFKRLYRRLRNMGDHGGYLLSRDNIASLFSSPADEADASEAE